MKKIMAVVIFLAVSCVEAMATNWEIVSIEKRQVEQKREYVMKLKDPYLAGNARIKVLSEEELGEIKNYFSVVNISDLIGNQFIDDPRHSGIVKSLCALK